MMRVLFHHHLLQIKRIHVTAPYCTMIWPVIFG